MSISLKGHIAVVIGASSGIGRATALALACEGARVVAAARREDRLRSLAAEADGAIEPFACDVTDRDQVGRLIAAAGRFDLLVYATGENIPDRAIEALPPATWDRMLSVNLTGAFNCTKAALPAMKAAGGGLIVYVSSISARTPDVSGVAYQAAKRGLMGLAHGTRVEERKNGIRTCVVCPGLVDTDMLKQRPKPTPQDQLDVALQPEDVADAIVGVARLNPRAVVPELEILPSRL